MNCQETQVLLESYLDSELDARACAEMQAHLSECRECARMLRQMETRLRDLESALRQGAKDGAMWERIERGLREATSAEPRQRASEAPEFGGLEPVRSSRRDGEREGDGGRECASWSFWLWPSPRLYAGLAFVWVLTLGLHLWGLDERGRAGVPEGGWMRTAEPQLRAQRRLMTELLGLVAEEGKGREGQAPQTRAAEDFVKNRV